MPSVTTVTISSTDYRTYADIEFAAEYLAADPINAATWAAFSDDQQGQYIVLATRIFDRMSWKGEKTDEDQEGEWPRTGIDGVDEDTLPLKFVQATVELAAQLANGVDVSNLQSTANNTKRMKAGSVEIEYFRGAEGQPYRLPLPVWELISQWLAGGGGSIVATSAGTCGVSELERGFGLNTGI